MVFVTGVAKGCLCALFVFLLVQTSGCTESPEPDEPPLVVHAEPPKTPLLPDWEMDAIQAAWDAACLNESSVYGSLHGWSTTRISPPPNDAGTVLPKRMTGIATCRDGSPHEVIILFDAR
jgi:hypothetical protein